ncbi:hypothetical protein [Halosimplex amylolyticum]|uniref:hypothetical protein n=1 Tax=Halosimplex amylolyticum TaxID=3396616 RepID=UPI003F577775
MSQSPLDGSDREGRSVADADRGTASPSLLGRVVNRLRSFGRSISARLPSVTDRADDYDGIEPTERSNFPVRTDRSRSVQCVGLTEEVLEGDGRAVTDDLVRARTDDADRDGPTDDRPELVVQWSDDELTLSAPDEPGAHITSTHWEDIER